MSALFSYKSVFEQLHSDLLTYRMQFLEYAQYNLHNDLFDSPIRDEVGEYLKRVSKKDCIIKLNKSRRSKGRLWSNYISGIEKIFENNWSRNYARTYGSSFNKWYETPNDLLIKRFPKPKDWFSIEDKIQRNWLHNSMSWYFGLDETVRKIRCKSKGKKMFSLNEINKMQVDAAIKYFRILQGVS